MDQFKVGDEVMLKSGGPRMTVESIAGDKATCIWYVDGELQRETFLMVLMKKPMPKIGAAFGTSS